MVREKSHRVDGFFLGSKLSEYFENCATGKFFQIWKNMEIDYYYKYKKKTK